MIQLVSAAILVCAALALAQRPSDDEAVALVERSRRKALDYAHSLPDFVCVESVKRFSDNRNRGQWTPFDRLAIKLSYFEEKESHKLISINDQPSDRAYDSLDGAVGVGEFGGTLHSIFDPASQAGFRWQSWKSVRKHRVALYSYTVELAHSRYVVATGQHGHLHEAVVGFHGDLEVDAQTAEVLHFTYVADRIPKDLNLEDAQSSVDYDFADVGGRQYLLPVRSATVMRTPVMSFKNEIEFHEYGKFAADSSISFDPGK